MEKYKASKKGGDFARNAKFINFHGCIIALYAISVALSTIITVLWQ
jgi:hypothetical protein